MENDGIRLVLVEPIKQPLMRIGREVLVALHALGLRHISLCHGSCSCVSRRGVIGSKANTALLKKGKRPCQPAFGRTRNVA